MGAEPPANLKILLGDLYLSGILPSLAGFPGISLPDPAGAGVGRVYGTGMARILMEPDILKQQE